MVLSIDSGTALWRMLKTWTNERARRSKNNAQLLEENPDAAIDVGMNLWNDATDRWLEVIHLLQTFPGIAIITARGKQITAIDDNGKPVKDRGRVLREWKVQAQKDLAFDCSVWVRMRRGRHPQVIKARSLQLRVEDGKPLNLPDFSIEDLVFNGLGCSMDSQPRQMPALVGDRVQAWLEDRDVEELQDVEKLRQLWWDAMRRGHRPDARRGRLHPWGDRAEGRRRRERAHRDGPGPGQRRRQAAGRRGAQGRRGARRRPRRRDRAGADAQARAQAHPRQDHGRQGPRPALSRPTSRST